MLHAVRSTIREYLTIDTDFGLEEAFYSQYTHLRGLHSPVLQQYLPLLALFKMRYLTAAKCEAYRNDEYDNAFFGELLDDIPPSFDFGHEPHCLSRCAARLLLPHSGP